MTISACCLIGRCAVQRLLDFLIIRDKILQVNVSPCVDEEIHIQGRSQLFDGFDFFGEERWRVRSILNVDS